MSELIEENDGMRRITIAHFSDLHFGNHDPAAVEALQIDLCRLAPDFLVVTGDLSQWSKRHQLQEAKEFLASTLEKIRKHDSFCQCVVVPGNHDLGFRKRGKNWNAVFQGRPFDSADCSPANLLEYYEQQGASKTNAASLSQKAMSLCEFYPEKNVAFLKLDSNAVSWWPANYARGEVGKKQLAHLLRILNDYNSAYAVFKQSRIIGLVHHHVQYLPSAESDQYLLMKDAGVVWEHLLDHGSELILHGHKHFSTHMCLRFLRGQEERELMIVSAGSAASLDQPAGQTYSYFHFTCDPAQYTVEHRQLSAAHFQSGAYPPLEFCRIPAIPMPVNNLNVDRVTLKAMLVPSTEDLESTYRLSKLRCNATIDSQLNYVAEYVFTGAPVTDNNECSFVFPVVAQGVSDPDNLHMRFSDQMGATLSSRVIAAGRHKFRFVIPADEFTHDEQNFTINASFILPRIMLPENDYDVIGFTRFVCGVDEFEYRLTTEMPIEGVTCYKILKNGLEELAVTEGVRSAGKQQFVVATRNGSEMGMGFMMCYQRLNMGDQVNAMPS